MQLPVSRTRIQARYSDTDAMGHISSGAYIAYMEVGRLAFFREILEQTGVDLITVQANITIDYISEARYGEDIDVVTWCARVGNKSLTIRQDILAGGRLAAKGSATNVAFDSETRKSAALPAGWEPSDHPETQATGAILYSGKPHHL